MDAKIPLLLEVWTISYGKYHGVVRGLVWFGVVYHSSRI